MAGPALNVFPIASFSCFRVRREEWRSFSFAISSVPQVPPPPLERIMFENTSV